MSHSPQDPHVEELLADAALFGLTDEEARELAKAAPQDDLTFELAAAAVDLATLRRLAAPAHLMGRLEGAVVPEKRARQSPPRRFISATRAGWLAAASCALVAAAGWVAFATKAVPPVVVERLVPAPPAPPPVQAPPADLATQRAELLARAPDVVNLAWTPTKDAAAAGASGDVVWSETLQRGFMRFRGLRVNDPAKTQYQLWVFDRTQEHPIDGGVFDVAADGEVTVPITAKLRVREPTLFAVTIEKPGGVVVSKKEHIVVTAAYKAG